MVLAREDAERYHRPPAALPRADRRRRQAARVYQYLRPPAARRLPRRVGQDAGGDRCLAPVIPGRPMGGSGMLA